MFLTLAEQIAYQRGNSTHADPQQLAWAILGVVLASEEADLVRSSRNHDLVSEGLQVFFAQQTPRGDWPQGKPLFNFRQAGNAYCYTYETLAELLALASDPLVGARDGFARLLRVHWKGLHRALTYAEQTAIPLDEAGEKVGWNSGSHPHRTQPESWATASVFRFGQRFRLVIGRWTAELAEAELGARRASEGISVLDERGGTWNLGYGTAGQQLSAAYVLPVLRRDGVFAGQYVDPDEKVLTERFGRSALLYGPPGTGKTTLVESVAGALGWPFVEISPAQFLDNGLDRVSARADEIFRRMMELDHCVVLLDEIDELVQQRNNLADPLERFFTTTMLPRLAKLWAMGKVMFFANTNDVTGVDTAIRRSQRFDSAILVMPPGPAAKARLLNDRGVVVPSSLFEEAAKELVEPKDEIDEIAWLALTRYDQISGLAARLSPQPTKAEVVSALGPIAKELLAQDWYPRAEDTGNPISVADTRVALKNLVKKELAAMVVAQRRDARLGLVIRKGVEYVDITPDPMDLDQWAADQQGTLEGSGRFEAAAPVTG